MTGLDACETVGGLREARGQTGYVAGGLCRNCCGTSRRGLGRRFSSRVRDHCRAETAGSSEPRACRAARSVRREFEPLRIESDGDGGFQANRSDVRRRESANRFGFMDRRTSPARHPPDGGALLGSGSRTHVDVRPRRGPGHRRTARIRVNEARKGISHRFPRTGSHPFELRIGRSASRGAIMENRRVTSQTLSIRLTASVNASVFTGRR